MEDKHIRNKENRYSYIRRTPKEKFSSAKMFLVKFLIHINCSTEVGLIRHAFLTSLSHVRKSDSACMNGT